MPGKTDDFERSRESSRQSSFRAISHPSVWIAVAVLVLNDLFGKTFYPSFLTGKLSDFAGLYFFPILAATLLSWTARTAGDPARLANIVWGLTALAWILLKATPVNGVAVDIFAALIGYAPALRRDPTDLIALVMLLPAYRLWRMESSRSPRTPVLQPAPGFAPIRRVRTFAPVVVALLACGNTTKPNHNEVRFLFATEDARVYAVAMADELNFWVPKNSLRYCMQYEGCTVGRFRADSPAFEPGNPPDEVADYSLAGLDRPQAFVANPADSDHRMRAHAEPSIKIEESRDGGKTWRTAWRIPRGRLAFMEKYRGGFLRGDPIVPGPFQLLWNEVGFFAAMGDQGVLWRDPSGEWHRLELEGYGASPTPFRSWSPAVLNIFLFEFLIVGASAIVFYFLLNAVLLLIASRNFKIGPWFPVSVILFMVILPPAASHGILFPTEETIFHSLVAGVLGTVASLISTLLAHLYLFRIAADRARIKYVFGVSHGMPALIPILAALCFYLWATGIIPFQEVAYGLAGALGLGVCIYTIFLLRK